MDSINKIKEFLKNKKYRAFLSLGFYALILIGAFIFITINNSSSTNIDNTYTTVIQKYQEMTTYQVSYTINDNLEISGYVINNKLTITYNGINYEINSEVTDTEIVNLLEQVNLLKLMPANIYNLVSLGNKIETSTDLVNAIYKNTYEVSLSDFITEYEGTTTQSDKMVTISTYEDSSNIIKVELNLEEYNNLDVIINYSNIEE